MGNPFEDPLKNALPPVEVASQEEAKQKTDEQNKAELAAVAASGSGVAGNIEKMEAEKVAKIDAVLNHYGHSWTSLKGLEKEQAEEVESLVNEFLASEDKERKKQIGERLDDILSV